MLAHLIRSKGPANITRRGGAIARRVGVTPASMARSLAAFAELLARYDAPATFPVTAMTAARNPASCTSCSTGRRGSSWRSTAAGMGITALIKQSRFPIKQMLTSGLLPSPLEVAYYRSRGAKIGCNVSIGPGAAIVAREIEIGDGASIGFGAYFKARKVQIGCYARIGARTILMQHTFINVARSVTIGDDTGIGGRCSIFTHGSWQNQLDGYPVTFAPVTISSNVWIPWEVFIMPGVTIGDGATIGAKSLVVKDIPAGALAVGSPAKVIRTSDQYPARLDHTRQVAMLRGMLDEFCEAMEYEAFQVARDRQEDFERVTITAQRGAAHVLLVYYKEVLNPEQCATAHVVLALAGLDAAARRALEADGRLWLDMAAKQRGSASNDLGEEVVDFLKRFGIRFARTS